MRGCDASERNYFLQSNSYIEFVGARSALGHVWTAPTGQGIFGFLLAVGSCVRPVCTALMTAGPDVIRKSGPYHEAALDGA
jgi:hypothetical protein